LQITIFVNRVWHVEKKREVDENLVQRAKFAPHVMFWLAFASTVKDNFIGHHNREDQGERKTLHRYFATETGLQTARLFCQLASLSNRTMHLHTLHV